ARQLRDFLRDTRIDQVLHLGQRQRRRRDRQRQDRRVGWIDFVVDRRRRQVCRQQRSCRVDRGLHFLFGDVETQREAELQRDDRCAAGTGGRHLVQTRHLPELAFERRGDR